MSEVVASALDLESLRSFMAVAQLGTLAAAAEQRHRTVSAISMQIKRLEERLGTRLLIRSARGMTLTPAGESLMREARALLSQHDRLLARFTGQGLSGRVRFGMPEDFARELVGQILPEFMAQHPDVLLEAVTATSGELARRLERGELTLALLLDRAHRLEGGQPLWRTSPVWAAAREYVLDPTQPLPLGLHPVEWPDPGNGVEALEAEERAWYAVFTSTSVHALETAVEAGLAISVLDRERLTPAMRELGPADGLPALTGGETQLHISKRMSAASKPAVDALAALLHERLYQRGLWRERGAR
jgi:DNA-binding transcriptional LysR family regulator